MFGSRRGVLGTGWIPNPTLVGSIPTPRANVARAAPRVAKVTQKMSEMSVLRFAFVRPLCYILVIERKVGRKMFYYEVKFANGETTVILSAGDPVEEIPVEFHGDVTNVETICEVMV